MKTIPTHRKLLTPVCLAAFVFNAHAASISVNFHLAGSSNQIDSADTAGVVASTNWNNVQDINTSGTTASATNLLDGSGTSTGTDLTVLGNSDAGSGDSGASSTTVGTQGDRDMMKSELGTSSGSITMQLRNLPAAYAATGFDVYIYSWGDDDVQTSSQSRYNGIYRFQLDADGAGVVDDFEDNTFMRNYNPAAGQDLWLGYVNNQFSTEAGVDAGSFSSYAKITIPGGINAANGIDLRVTNVNEGAGREMAQGFQIVQIPEPSSFALLVSGLGLLVLRRRA